MQVLFLLCCRVGADSVIASDVRSSRRLLESGPFSYCDVMDKDNMARIILENGITHVVHLATLLSGRLEVSASFSGHARTAADSRCLRGVEPLSAVTAGIKVQEQLLSPRSL